MCVSGDCVGDPVAIATTAVVEVGRWRRRSAPHNVIVVVIIELEAAKWSVTQ